ncbi:tRNA (adenosine(37)-N6)-threonylcarbamoyltransferase complex ATPase subunit type 1 TsaE [Patescibacteria group bacterium]|nr:tRNA (adenosine(37)-N6)-threonylcarbamoyltransferase complex ATPase subunit type 1 TsaE [Patescibacteria group bacterium]MBU4511761.1 tRNA (adenosine(37)-N6)-threonylcarbamoyltransferase complex ATPase subunit type 1 TsaE [Patescibacteria group bacterium]
MKKIITKSALETMKLGEKLANRFRGGETIALTGDLGTGKTTLIKGIAKGLGVKKNITSPTFVLMKTYDTDGHGYKTDSHGSRIRQLCHADAYRINNGQELKDIGIMEYIDDPRTLTIIEWAEKVKEILPLSTRSASSALSSEPKGRSRSHLRSMIIWIKMGYGKKENEREIEVISPSID